MANESRFLLDTSTFLWAAADSKRLSKPAAKIIAAQKSKLYVSVASVWEMQIKHALGKLSLPDTAVGTAERYAAVLQVEIIPITLEAILCLDSLDQSHRDPFDRILAAQSIANNLALISPDKAFASFPISLLW